MGHHLTAALQQKRSKLVAQRRAIHFPTVMARLHVSNAARNGYVVVGMRLSDGRIYFGCERIDKLIVKRRRYGDVRPEKLRAKTRQRAAGVATDGKGGVSKALGIDGNAKARPIGNPRLLRSLRLVDGHLLGQGGVLLILLRSRFGRLSRGFVRCEDGDAGCAKRMRIRVING